MIIVRIVIFYYFLASLFMYPSSSFLNIAEQQFNQKKNELKKSVQALPKLLSIARALKPHHVHVFEALFCMRIKDLQQKYFKGFTRVYKEIQNTDSTTQGKGQLSTQQTAQFEKVFNTIADNTGTLKDKNKQITSLDIQEDEGSSDTASFKEVYQQIEDQNGPPTMHAIKPDNETSSNGKTIPQQASEVFETVYQEITNPNTNSSILSTKKDISADEATSKETKNKYPQAFKKAYSQAVHNYKNSPIKNKLNFPIKFESKL